MALRPQLRSPPNSKEKIELRMITIIATSKVMGVEDVGARNVEQWMKEDNANKSALPESRSNQNSRESMKECAWSLNGVNGRADSQQ